MNSDNNIQHLDAHIAANTALEYLNVCGNTLKKIPTTFSACTNLKTLAVANNMLTDFPSELCNLLCLTTLDVSGNQVRLKRIYACALLSRLLPARAVLDRH